MPSHYVAKCAFNVGSDLPRDVMMINPCFRRAPALTDMDGLASDLATVLDTWAGTGQFKISVRFYDLEGTKPVYPDGVATKNSGITTSAIAVNREVALCLSFYADHPAPRRRGRLYLPYALLGAGASSMAERPTTSQRTKASGLVAGFAGLGGADVDWIVWSRADHAAHTVTNWWVDDEWDVQRRRGLKATTRTAGSTAG